MTAEARERPVPGWQPWRTAWQAALYGPDGFYLRPEGPAGHFRTAAHAAGPQLAAALLRLAGQHGCTSIVDVGAGRGELLTALAHSDRLAAGFGLHGVDMVNRPGSLPDRVSWSRGLALTPERAFEGALVVGWELLDVVPCPILEIGEDGGPRELLVEPCTGRERPGEPGADADLAWCAQWWPLSGAEPGSRAEVGRPRDAVWAALLSRSAAAGARTALAVDYGHRAADRPAAGSLTGFRRGRAVPPRPDGSMDVTAHVAMDSVEAAGIVAGATSSTLVPQHEALRELGVRSAELLDPGSLGGFDWLLQTLAR